MIKTLWFPREDPELLLDHWSEHLTFQVAVCHPEGLLSYLILNAYRWEVLHG
jgi:hypothetical protein